MKRVLLGGAALLATVAVAVPAASATTFTLRAGGSVLDNPFAPRFTTPARFTINLKAGPGHKLTYIDQATGLNFRSLHLASVVFTRSAVKITGLGFVGGQRVHFTAIATDNKATGVDAFKISWNHKASHGGSLASGTSASRRSASADAAQSGQNGSGRQGSQQQERIDERPFRVLVDGEEGERDEQQALRPPPGDRPDRDRQGDDGGQPAPALVDERVDPEQPRAHRARPRPRRSTRRDRGDARAARTRRRTSRPRRDARDEHEREEREDPEPAVADAR